MFGGSLLLLQPIADSIIAGLFGLFSRMAGEPIAAFPYITLATVWFSLVLALRVVDEGSWESVGLGEGAWRPRVLAAGLALGVATIGVTALVLFVGGWLRFEPAAVFELSWAGAAFRLLVLLAPAALWEELLFRGYLFTVAEEAGGTKVALWTSSVLFGVVHLQNPGAGVQTTVLVVLAGWCLGLLRVRTGSLPAAWAAHLAWNWTMAAVLHVPVSGLPLPAPGYRAVVSGPSWLTGGSWGPEGGAIAALTLAAALAIALRTTSTNKRTEA